MPTTVVQTSYGMVQGVQEATISIWKGIPYAQPPLGARRFRPPQSPEAWTDVLQTTQFRPMAITPGVRERGGPLVCRTARYWS
jgi:para-nitrobenzyl esterase